jgi:hypothetical protein
MLTEAWSDGDATSAAVGSAIPATGAASVAAAAPQGGRVPAHEDEQQEESHQDVADCLPLLLDLPDEALINILGHLRDPLPLATACRHLSGLLRSRALHVSWLSRHGAAVAPRRPPAGRVLTFRPLRGAPARELAATLLRLHSAISQIDGGGGSSGYCSAEAVAVAWASLRSGQVRRRLCGGAVLSRVVVRRATSPSSENSRPFQSPGKH